MIIFGTLVFLKTNLHSKSESVQPFLYLNKDSMVQLYVKGDNPFENESLLPFDGQFITVDGDYDSLGIFRINKDTISQIKNQGSKNDDAEE